MRLDSCSAGRCLRLVRPPTNLYRLAFVLDWARCFFAGRPRSVFPSHELDPSVVALAADADADADANAPAVSFGPVAAAAADADAPGKIHSLMSLEEAFLFYVDFIVFLKTLYCVTYLLPSMTRTSY